MYLELEHLLWTALKLARKANDAFLAYLIMMALTECRSREEPDTDHEENVTPRLMEQG